MPLAKFLLYSTVGSLAWTGLLTATGFLLESNYTQAATYLDPVSKLVLGSLLAWYLYRFFTYRPQEA
jgi:membrane protein DedA with SNARE-associated domain